jgi:hypothetical protein
MEDGPKARYNLNLINPSGGGSIWHYHQNNQRLIRVEARENWILLQFDGKTVVLKFWAL